MCKLDPYTSQMWCNCLPLQKSQSHLHESFPLTEEDLMAVLTRQLKYIDAALVLEMYHVVYV